MGSEGNMNDKIRYIPFSPDGMEKIATYNWKYGLCTHKIVFEAAENIKKMRFCGDLLGNVLLVLLSYYHHHPTPPSACSDVLSSC